MLGNYNWNGAVPQDPNNPMGNPGGGFFQMGNYGQPAAPVDSSMQMPMGGFNFAPQAAPQNSFLNGFLGSTDVNGIQTPGWGGTAIAGAQGLMNLFMGMKQYGLYKDQLSQSKRQFNLNYNAQRQTTNAALEDRQRARVASNPGAYQSPSDYMDQYGIKKG